MFDSYFFVDIYFMLNSFSKLANRHTDMQIKQCFEWYWGLSMNANEEMFAGNADADASDPDADLDAT